MSNHCILEANKEKPYGGTIPPALSLYVRGLMGINVGRLVKFFKGVCRED